MTEHRIVEISKRPVKVDWLDGMLEWPIIEHVDGDPGEVVWGCDVCGMGIKEASQSPCPGHPMGDFEDLVSDGEVIRRVERDRTEGGDEERQG